MMDLSALASHFVVGFFGTIAGAGVAYKAVMAEVKALREVSKQHDRRIEKLEDSRTEVVVTDLCQRMRDECQNRLFTGLEEIKGSIKRNAESLQTLREDLTEVIKYQQRVLQKLDIR